MADINLGVGGANSAVAGGYDIANSLKLEPDNAPYLYKTQSDGNKKTWTCSFWFKRTELNDSAFPAFISATSSSWATRISIFNDGSFWVDLGYGTSYYRNIAYNKIRDTAAWYHFVVAVDSTQATASDRLKAYINGNLITDWGAQNLPAQNTEFKFFDSAHTMYIGNYNNAVSFEPAGYMAEMNLIEGQQLAASDFGEFDTDTGIWKPKAYTGSYGTNGFYLDFENSASLGADGSGNGNNFTLQNITSADQATDTPTNNFNIFLSNGHLFNTSGGDNADIREGGTKVQHQYATGWATAFTQISVANGKWYAEFEANNITSKPNVMFGVIPTYMTAATTNWYIGGAADDSKGVGFYCSDKKVYYQNATVGSPQTVNNGDIIGVALDMDNGKAHFSVNNTWINSSNPETNANGYALLSGEEYMFAVSVYNPDAVYPCNFGGYTANTISSAASDANGYGTFEYAPPSGYYALCSKNLAEFG